MEIRRDFLLLIAIPLLVRADYVSYEGYKVYEILPQNEEEVDFLYALKRKGMDFWKLDRFVNSVARLMVPPEEQEQLEAMLEDRGIEFEEYIQNIERTIENERDQLARFRKLERGVSFKVFHRHNEINDYLKSLAKRYPKRVKVRRVGRSTERRDLKIISITNGANTTDPRSVIFVDAGVHAREWIAPATALYLISELVENKEKNENLLDDMEWIILPVVNPDGYEYSHDRDRLWRKTRRKSDRRCVGVDGNRNYDHSWGKSGASANSCAQTYRGDKPFSEPEIQAVRDVMASVRDRCKFYLSLHSHGRYFLYPWGHTSDLPNNHHDQDEIARAGADAIRRATGAKYRVGSSRNVLYPAAGLSVDYAHGVENIPVAITMELPGGGRSGFDPPPGAIEKSVRESWEGIRAMAQRVVEKYVAHRRHYFK